MPCPARPLINSLTCIDSRRRFYNSHSKTLILSYGFGPAVIRIDSSNAVCMMNGRCRSSQLPNLGRRLKVPGHVFDSNDSFVMVARHLENDRKSLGRGPVPTKSGGALEALLAESVAQV
jgi:hypothetical protein